MGTIDALHMTISHTHGRWPVRVFTSLREMIRQPCHCSRCHVFCPITSLQLSTATLTNEGPVTLSNYEVWYYGLADYDALPCPSRWFANYLNWISTVCLFALSIG